MKLYKHSVVAAQSNNVSTDVSNMCSVVFNENIDNICEIIKEHVHERVSSMLRNYVYLDDFMRRVTEVIVTDNLFHDSIQIPKRYYGLGDVTILNNIIYIRFPVYLLCEYFFASGYSSSRIANDHSEDFYNFVESRNYLGLTTFVQACDHNSDITDLSEDRLKSKVEHIFSNESIEHAGIQLLYDPERFRCTSDPTCDSPIDMDKFENICNEFIKYCKTNYKSSRNSKWMNIVDTLESESNEGINSIYEQTEAGNYIDSIVQSIEDSLGIWSEPSIQAGHGIIEFLDKNTDEVLLTKDYEEYCDDIIDMAIASKSKKGFMSQLKQYYDI